METTIHIGKLELNLHLPVHYPWQASDLAFQEKQAKPLRRIEVQLEHVSSIAKIPEPPVFQGTPDDEIGGALTVWQTPEGELRHYRALFAPSHPLYAQSRLAGDRITIDYLPQTNLWNHPNMQLWNLLHLENLLLSVDALVLHSCYLHYRGKAILFTAPSGTGKTTQGKLWERLYDARIINGDKTLLQKDGEAWLAEGYPFHGSAPECENEAYPIGAIVIVRQDKTDYVEELSPIKKAGMLYSECTVNSWNAQAVNRTMDLLFDLVWHVPVVMLHCTLADSAGEVLQQYLSTL